MLGPLHFTLQLNICPVCALHLSGAFNSYLGSVETNKAAGLSGYIFGSSVRTVIAYPVQQTNTGSDEADSHLLVSWFPTSGSQSHLYGLAR